MPTVETESSGDDRGESASGFWGDDELSTRSQQKKIAAQELNRGVAGRLKPSLTGCNQPKSGMRP